MNDQSTSETKEILCENDKENVLSDSILNVDEEKVIPIKRPSNFQKNVKMAEIQIKKRSSIRKRKILNNGESSNLAESSETNHKNFNICDSVRRSRRASSKKINYALPPLKCKMRREV